jgi:hypothetical protein
MPRALRSISFSRGFGLTASQLGVLLVPEGHPRVQRFENRDLDSRRRPCMLRRDDES